MVVALDDVTLLNDSQVFSLEDAGSYPYELDGVVASISIQGNSDLKVIERSNYSVLDLLGDIGGLESMLFSLVALLLSVLNYNNLDN